MGPVFRGLGVLLASLALLAEGPPDDAARIFAVTGAQTSGVRSYTFALHVDFALRTFPYLAFHLNGRGSWARPDLYSVRFKNVPWFARGFENVKLDALEPVTWPQQYAVVSIAHDGDLAILEMRDRTAGNVKNVHAEIDSDGLRSIRWLYVNGGRIRVDVTPRPVDGVPLPQSESAEIELPGYHVVAHATFDDYKIITDTTAGDGTR
jgi:hypothetical protein